MLATPLGQGEKRAERKAFEGKLPKSFLQRAFVVAAAAAAVASSAAAPKPVNATRLCVSLSSPPPPASCLAACSTRPPVYANARENIQNISIFRSFSVVFRCCFQFHAALCGRCWRGREVRLGELQPETTASLPAMRCR